MDWYLKVIQNYATFDGRARRKEYWMFYLIHSLISFALQLPTVISREIGFLHIIVLIYSLALIVPSIAVTVRRLHDVGKSGWVMLISLIPIIGGIWLFILLVTEGTAGSNDYGMDPKELEYASQEV